MISAASLRTSWKQRGAFLAAGFLLVVVAPAVLSEFRLSLLSQYLLFAIVAIGIDLSWGYGGMLTIGQGLFFGLGGYAMGMLLKLQAAGPGKLPDFMVWNGVTKLPGLWKPFAHGWFAISAAIIVPMIVAALLGLLIFRRRVRGAYFAILCQALAAAFALTLIGNQGLTGGTNGLTNVNVLMGYDLHDPVNKKSLYVLIAVLLGAMYILARQIVQSRFGRLLMAVRDGEDRVRFLGYNPTTVKVIAFTISAGMAGLAGALFVPVVGIISPSLLGIVPSIEMVIWVAVGGRGTLVGAVLGAILVNYAKTSLSEAFPSGWTYFLGLLFVVVMAFFPKGIAGLFGMMKKRTKTGKVPELAHEPELEPAA